MTSPNGIVEVQDIIHDTLSKALGSEIKLNNIFVTSPKCTTLLEVKQNIHDTLIMV